MAYRWGFKKQANELALEVRDEAGLDPLDPLDPFALAEDLAIPTIPLSRLADAEPEAVAFLTDEEPGCFSGVTVFRGQRRVIVYNDAHVRGRQHSDVSHEIAHALLHHQPAPAFGDGGCRNWDQDLEDEANFLGAALLVTEEATLYVVRRELEVGHAATLFGVSREMMQWRINATGARKRVARSRNYSG